MELEEEEPPPFWLQSTTALHQADCHRRRRHQAASSLFLNTGVLVVFLLLAAIVFLAVVIPSVLSLARQVFNPSLVKSSWNSLNLILVIFAIVCGFLGRKDNDDQTPRSSPMRRETGKTAESSSSPRQWYEYQDSRMAYNNSFGNVDTIRRLRRNSSSYPDLRQEGPWMVNENRWRSYDDTHVYSQQFVRSESRISRSRSLGVVDEEVDVKSIEMDTCVSSGNEVTPPITPPSPLPRTMTSARKNGQVRSREVVDEDQCVTKNIEMDTVVRCQTKVLKSEPEIPSSDHQPAPPSPPAYVKQPLSPPSPLTPTTYFWPPPSPPPPPPPPPPSSRRKHDNKQTLFPQQPFSPPSPVSPTNYFWPPPSPPPPPPPPPPSSRRKHENKQTSFPQQPFSPPSPVSSTNYFWPPPSPPPPPPPPPPARTHSSILAKKKHDNKRNSPPKREPRSHIEIPMPPPPPPPPLPPATPPRSRTKVSQSSEDKRDKKGGIVIRTLGRLPRRKRKQTRRSYENLSELNEPPKVSIHRSKSTPEFPPLSPPRPPPPPPPPPPSLFHNIFSKKGKNTKKKVHSIPTSAPPPPPPPPAKPQPKQKIPPPASRRSVAPAKTDSFSSVDENICNGSESPLITVPPRPPPPPPFKMPSWKFIMQGNYVKIESNNNSPRSGYSASEDEDSSPSDQKTTTKSAFFCPSPDVNTKADDFIARFRAKLTLEKMNSIKQNQGTGPSPLGSETGRP